MNIHAVPGGGGLSLNVVEAGTRGAPSLLFLHGLSQSSDVWMEQFASSLTEAFHLCALDLRGHGASEKPLGAAAYHDATLWAEDVRAVIEGLKLNRPVLIAWSYGGIVALDYLKVFGEARVSGLVMVAALSRNAVEAAYAHLGEGTRYIKEMFSLDFGKNYSATLHFAQAMTAAPPPEDALRRRLGAMMMTPPQIRRNLSSRKVDHTGTLSTLSLPVLCLHGDADRVVKLSSSQHTLRNASNASLIRYEGVGHAPFLEVAAHFNQDLAAFARSVTRTST